MIIERAGLPTTGLAKMISSLKVKTVFKPKLFPVSNNVNGEL